MSTVVVSNVHFEPTANNRIQLSTGNVTVFQNGSQYVTVNNSTFTINTGTKTVTSQIYNVGDYFTTAGLSSPPDATFIETDNFYLKTSYPVISSLIGDYLKLYERWYQSNTPATNSIFYTTAAYGNGIFCVIGYNNSTNRSDEILYSTDAITWSYVPTTNTSVRTDMTYGNGVFVSVGANSIIQSSTNGVDWTTRTSPITNAPLYQVTYGNGVFVATGGTGVASGNTILSSTDGTTWTNRSSYTGGYSFNDFRSLGYGNGLFVAVAVYNSTTLQISTSTDSITWTFRTPANTTSVSVISKSVAYGNGKYVFSSWHNSTLIYHSSTNGIAWSTNPGATNIYKNDIAFGDGVFISTGTGGGTIEYSTDGVTWSANVAEATSGDQYTVTYGDYGIFMITGQSRTIQRTFNRNQFYIPNPMANFGANNVTQKAFIKAT